MSVQLHPNIDQLDKSSLCYSIYSQLYQNFFNAQDRRDNEHPYGIVEGDETSIRLKNSAYGFASAIAGSVVGEGGSGGESGGVLLDYLKKTGGDMVGMLRANYGFEAGMENTRILAVYAERQTNEVGEITGTNYGVRVSGDLYIGGQSFYLGERRILSYDTAKGIASFDTEKIDFGVAKMQSAGEFVIGKSREQGVLITSTLLQVGGHDVYHTGNANLDTVNWKMLDASISGQLNVAGKSILSGKVYALYGAYLGSDGKTIVQIDHGGMALNGYLSLGVGYGIKIGDIPVLIRASEKEIQLGSIGGDLLLGGEHTTKIRLLSGVSDLNGDYVLLSAYGDGYFPGSLVVRHNRGTELLSSYRVDANDEGIVLHKRLRFGTSHGVFLCSEGNGLSFHSSVIQDKEEGRIVQPCSSRMEHRLSTSFYQPQNRDSYTFYLNTDTDFVGVGAPLEARGHLGIDGSYTRLTDGALFFSEESRLQVIAGGIKHYGNSTFRGNLSSELFSSGFSGSGWAIMLNRTTGGITATFDEIVARRKFRAYEFEVMKISATNGSLWVSDSCSGDSVEKL